MANYDETLAAAREQAESKLDDVLQLMREELHGVPSEHRFEMMMLILKRIDLDPFVAWVIVAVAAERLLLHEELDQDLAPPAE